MELAKAIRDARRTFICGNGGSAANAIHFANDLVMVGARAQALTADIATLTRIANDDGYERIFSSQLMTLAEKGDLLIVLSGSGKSKNILAALYAAMKLEMRRWAIVGNYGDKAMPLHAERVIRRGENMQKAEEAQLAIAHEAMKWLRGSPRG